MISYAVQLFDKTTGILPLSIQKESRVDMDFISRIDLVIESFHGEKKKVEIFGFAKHQSVQESWHFFGVW